jgi:hypothetical protein
MKALKKRISTLILTTTLSLGAITAPTQKAEAGVIVAAASSLYVTIPALAIAGMVGGFGTAVGSIYYAIDHRDRAWWAYAFFMLDQDVENGNLKTLIEKRYPGIDNAVAEELAVRIATQARGIAFDEKGLKDVILPASEIAPILELLAETNPSLGQKIEQELTRATVIGQN